MARNRKRNRGKGKPMAAMPHKKEMAKEAMMGAGMAAAAPEAMMGAGGGTAKGEPESNVSPEEQELYERVLAKYVSGVYVKGREPTKDGSPPLLEQIHSGFRTAADEGNITSFVDVLGNTVARAVMALEDKMEEEDGVKVSGDVLMHVGEWILNDLAELSEAAGYHDYTPKEMTGAATQAFSIYGDERNSQGRLDTDAIQADYNEIVAADKAGRLDDVLPGASQAAEEIGEEPPQEEVGPQGVGAARAGRPPPGRGIA